VVQKLFYTASILDEVGYLFEFATPYSITFGATMTLEGDINSEVVKEALDAALNYYPKFKCILVKDYPSIKHWFRYSWKYQNISSEDILEKVEDNTSEGAGKDAVSYIRHYYPSHTIDITRETPLKVLLIRNHRCTHLLFFIHHAAADGLSAIFFIKHFIYFYEDIFYQEKKKNYLIPDYEAIARPDIRFRWNYFSPKLISSFSRNTSLPKKEPPVPIYPLEENEQEKKFIAATKQISPQQFRFIRTNAKNHQTTINNYLLAAMFQAINKWNQKWNSRAGCIYISAPVSLRPPGEHTVGNFVSQFYISCRSELIDNKDKLLELIQEEKSYKIKHAREHINLSWFLKIIPLALKMLIFKNRAPTIHPTIILSNVGICDPNPHHKDEEGFHYMGPARICSIHIIPHPFLWPLVTIVSYNDRMSISLSVVRSHFSLNNAEEFLDFFIQKLMAP